MLRPLPAAADLCRQLVRATARPDRIGAGRVGQHQASAARAKPLSTANCAVGIAPSLYAKVSTAHFSVYYTVFGGTSFVAENARSAAAAAGVASLVEAVYDAEVKLIDPLDRLDDSKEACNGGDKKYDIYYGPYGLGGIAAWTTTYALAPEQIGTKSECALRPSYMMLNSLSASSSSPRSNSRRIRGRWSRASSPTSSCTRCSSRWPARRAARTSSGSTRRRRSGRWTTSCPRSPHGLPGEFGMEPGLGSVASNYAKSGSVLAAYLYAGHLTSIEKPGPVIDPKLNGYSDYLFFQYLARTKGPDTIKQIFDALAGGRNSVEAIAAAVDMKSVWPGVRRTLWIGWEDKVLDYWANEDEYRFGLAQVYAQVPTGSEDPPGVEGQAEDDPGRPEGQKSAKFELLANALDSSGNYEIEPRSIHYEHLKFSDPTVHAVVFYNPIADRTDNGPMKLAGAEEDRRQVAGARRLDPGRVQEPLPRQPGRAPPGTPPHRQQQRGKPRQRNPVHVRQPVADEAGDLERRLLAMVRHGEPDHRDGCSATPRWEA